MSNKDCPICNGTGYDAGRRDDTCQSCNGTGRREVYEDKQSDFHEGFDGEKVCNYCNGLRTIAGEDCPNCK